MGLGAKKRTLNDPIVSRRLKGLLVENDITVNGLSGKMDIPEKILMQKINGRSEWLYKEMVFIMRLFGYSEVKMAFPELYNSILERET